LINFIIKDKLAGMPLPDIDNLPIFLKKIRKQEFNVIISLYDPKAYVERNFALMDLSEFEIEHYSFKCPVFNIPQKKVIFKIIDLLEKKIFDENKKVIMHCGAGLGRTGTIAAVFLRYLDENLSGEECLLKIRKEYNREAVETAEQEEFVISWNVFKSDTIKNK